MKKINLILTIFMAFILLSACSDDPAPVADACHGCHLEATIVEMHFEGDFDANGDSIFEQHEELEIWDIKNSAGGTEFCGSELITAEAPDYVHTTTEDLVGRFYGAILPAGSYGPGTDTIYVIHCEDHPDDGHNH